MSYCSYLISTYIKYPTTRADGRIKAPLVERAIAIKRCPASTSVYTGRENQIQQVGACIIGSSDERRVCVVHGLGGAGKTQLALKTIERNRDSWRHVLYVDASSKEAIESTLQDYAKAKKIGRTHEDILSWLESCGETWLVVMDNADDPAMNVYEYFPGGNHGSILITTRLSDLVVHARGPGSTCHISSMSHDEALVLLLKLARKIDQEINETEMRAANGLLQVSGGVLNSFVLCLLD